MYVTMMNCLKSFSRCMLTYTTVGIIEVRSIGEILKLVLVADGEVAHKARL